MLDSELLHDAAGSPLTAFGGPHVERLAALVSAATGRGNFSKPPLGPIGAFLKLRDPQWAVAIEACMGSLYDQWVVNNQDDAALLRVRNVVEQELLP